MHRNPYRLYCWFSHDTAHACFIFIGRIKLVSGTVKIVRERKVGVRSVGKRVDHYTKNARTML